jgi:hypothetical protein
MYNYPAGIQRLDKSSLPFILTADDIELNYEELLPPDQPDFLVSSW